MSTLRELAVQYLVNGEARGRTDGLRQMHLLTKVLEVDNIMVH